MNEGQISFTLDYEQFDEILSQQNWFKLQHEFENNDASLSQSFLICEGNSSYTWLLADFKTEKTYEIKGNLVTEKPDTVVVSESSNQKGQLIDLAEPYSIFSRLEQNPKGTDEGYVDFFTKLNINLSKLNLDKLKRSDLSEAGFSFESAHRSLSIVHKKFCEILTAPNESLVDLSRADLQTVASDLKQFYRYAKQITDFEIKGQNPRQNYNKLLGTISQFCENMKEPLKKHIAYLNSRVERVNTAIGDEVDKLQKIGEEAQQNEEKRQESFDQIYVQLQNQLANEQLEKYKIIFQNQAKKHGRMSWIWLAVTGVLAVGFAIIFWEFLIDIGSAANQVNQLSTILSNLFVRGFYISLIFLLLNRTIKNYSAEKHLEVINTHRQNALETFEAFVAAAEGNRDTRDQVLLAATKAIFDANQSGYLSAKSSGSDSASPVQHFIKEVLPSKSSSDSN